MSTIGGIVKKRLLARLTNPVPEIVMIPFTPLDGGLRLDITGLNAVNDKLALLATEPTVTTTGPVVTVAGTFAAIAGWAHEVMEDAAAPLKVTVPWVVPKLVPVIVTDVPTGPEVGVMLTMYGIKTALNETLSKVAVARLALLPLSTAKPT